MIEETVKFVLRHPIKNTTLDVYFPSETAMDDWWVYFNDFEDYLIHKALEKKMVTLAQG
jgi:hypothetical protein